MSKMRREAERIAAMVETWPRGMQRAASFNRKSGGAMSEHTPETIDRWFCACASYPDDPGMVVCWKCENPLVEIDPGAGINEALIHNLLSAGIRHRAQLGKIADAVGRSEVRLVNGGCNVPGYKGGHTVFFEGDDWFTVQAAKDALYA